MDIQEITRSARDFLLVHGKHPPTVFVEVEHDEQPHVLPFANFPFDTTEERERGLFAAARRFARVSKKHLKGKRILALAFICEGWGAQVQRGAAWTRPSRHPDRREILFILSLEVASMHQEAAAFEMLRPTGGAIDLVSLAEPEEVCSSLLPAFLTGLQTASLDEGMARAKLRRVCEAYGVRRKDA